MFIPKFFSFVKPICSYLIHIMETILVNYGSHCAVLKAFPKSAFAKNFSCIETKSILHHTLSLRKIWEFHLISWCGNFVERHSFRRVLGDSLEALRKLCLLTKFPHQEIR